jgi:sugar phosphate isomerase/epimerase
MDTTATFRRDLNMGGTWLLPAWSTAPVGDERAVLEGAREAGYEGIQGANPELCRELGLVPTTFDIRIEVGGMREQATRFADQGFACATLMVGTGLESDDDAARLMEEIVAASIDARFPLYVETHRATATQDIWRTLRLVERFPELRFNGDFSHWYTAHDLPIGDFEAKLDLMAPVFDRVRYMHGRIGTSGCIQVDVGDGRVEGQPHVGHFRAMWTRACAGFIAGAADDPVPPPDLQLGFAPELLPNEFGYAIKVPNADGELDELGDRWQQAVVLTDIAQECFAAAEGSTT